MKKFFVGILFLGLLIFSSCGPARFVEPLKRGQNALAVSAGGPIINVPGVATLPLPMSSVTYGRGVTNNITAYGSWFMTAAVFGTFQFDAGATVKMWGNDKNDQGVSISPGFNFAIDRFEQNFKFWPQFDAHYYWNYNSRQMEQDDLLTGKRFAANKLYTGIGSWYELSGSRAHGEKQNTRVIPTIQIGHDLNWNSWSFKTELKLIAPFNSNENIVVDYKSLTGKYGATGFYFGFTKTF